MTEQQVGPAAGAAAVGETIHTIMWRRRISQGTVAAALGLSQGMVSRKLHGVTPMTVGELLTIAGVLGVEPGDLLPRLDSNQEPSGYVSPQVSGCSRCGDRGCDWCRGVLVELAAWRERRAS